MVATAAAQEMMDYGDICSATEPCADEALTCVDGLCDDNMTLCGYCQDCSLEGRMWTDGYFFECPGEATEEGSTHIAASVAAATLALSVIMA